MVLAPTIQALAQSSSVWSSANGLGVLMRATRSVGSGATDSTRQCSAPLGARDADVLFSWHLARGHSKSGQARFSLATSRDRGDQPQIFFQKEEKEKKMRKKI